MSQKSVCIAPLDWGLGHATRCIELIRAFQALNYTIYIATDGKQEVILREAIPNANFLHLKGYNIRYTKTNVLLIPALLFQLPKIIRSIVYENRWLKQVAKKHHFDLIISDNRFGFFHKKITSVFITHQLELQTPFKWSTRWLQKITYQCIHRFAACWVPDMQPPHNLAGVLANPSKLPSKPIWYMNGLSRLARTTKMENNHADAIQFLGIVSGPEPQRAIFENILWQQGNELNEPFVLIAGLPNEKHYHKISAKGKVFHHVESAALIEQIHAASFIICRGGYTTLMELVPFRKKLILIPTPGQTEQEYLAKYWEEKKWAIHCNQSNFQLPQALQKAANFEYEVPPFLAFDKEGLVNELKRLSL